MTKNIIELDKLSKHFGRFQALKEINLTLAPAEILGFIDDDRFDVQAFVQAEKFLL